QRAAKAVKLEPKANIGRKVATVLPEIIEISDDNEDNVSSLKPSLKDDEMMLRYVQESRPQRHAPSPCKPAIARDVGWGFSKKDNTPSESDFTPDFIKERVTSDFDVKSKKSIEQSHDPREELRAAQDTITKLRQEMEKQNADKCLDRSKADAEAKKDCLRLIQELETQGQEIQDVAAERDRLRKQCELQQDTMAKNTALEAELLSLRNLVVELRAQHIQEKTLRQRQQENHEDTLQELLKSKGSAKYDAQLDESNERVCALEAEKIRLVKEVEALRVVTSSSPRPTLSPVPSQTSASTDENKREDNVRKMFVRTKRQYDVLFSVATNLAICTRSMDLTSFGEFGRHLKRLRTTLETDTGVNEARSHALVFRKE
ncbi:hypothetical protein BKA63DRAFT_385201, partial [Paraphoma chrysanthemicola]